MSQLDIDYVLQTRRLAEIIFHFLDAVDKLAAHAGDEEFSQWWWELRNDIKPTLDWAIKTGSWR